MFTHILKFLGILVVLSVLANFIPFGNSIGACIVLYAIWKMVA